MSARSGVILLLLLLRLRTRLPPPAVVAMVCDEDEDDRGAVVAVLVSSLTNAEWPALLRALSLLPVGEGSTIDKEESDWEGREGTVSERLRGRGLFRVTATAAEAGACLFGESIAVNCSGATSAIGVKKGVERHSSEFAAAPVSNGDTLAEEGRDGEGDEGEEEEDAEEAEEDEDEDGRRREEDEEDDIATRSPAKEANAGPPAPAVAVEDDAAAAVSPSATASRALAPRT